MADAPALARALKYLHRHIEHRENAPDGRLPTLRAMAAEARVSHVTMNRAVKEYRRRGLLTTLPGGHIALAGSPVSETSQPAVPAALAERPARARQTPRWELVAERLQSAVLKGVHGPGSPLPSPKELCESCGVCYRTLRKALDLLERRGVVERHKKRYRVPLGGGPANRHTVVLVARGYSDGEMLTMERTREHIRLLERQCSRMGLELMILTTDPSGLTLSAQHRRRHAVADINKVPGLLGILLWTIGLNVAGMPRLIDTLAVAGVPLAVLDEAGVLDHLPRLFPVPSIRFFTMANRPIDGRITGRYLIEQGHRRAAYFSPIHAPIWSRNRLAGLRSASLSRTPLLEVIPFVHDVEPLPNARRGAESSITRAVLATIEKAARAGKTAPADRVAADIYRTASRMLLGLGQYEVYYRRLLPMFERALTDREITVWVGASDSFVLPALDFLKQHRIAVPDQLSVIGFDDSLEASASNLTSYNFNGAAVMQEMLRHMVAPDIGRRRRMVGTYEQIEGFVTVRGTIGGIAD